MGKSLERALNEVNMTYKELIEIANNLAEPCVKEVNQIVQPIKNNIENLTNDDIRNILIKLSVCSFSFGELKEKSAFKAQCAETIRKERYAEEFSLADGSVASKDSVALRKVSEEVLVESIYDLVSQLLKTKLDEIHRLVDTLKTVLITRLNEAKLVQVDSQM